MRIDSPTPAVITDLRQIPAATIDLEAPVDAAYRFMIRRGVRLPGVAIQTTEVARSFAEIGAALAR